MIKMLRWTLVAGLVFLSLDRAAACSLALPTIESLADGAQLVVIGTVSDAGEDAATLEIEQYLKGGAGDREISLVNHEFGLGAACEPLLGPGSRWSDGTRVLAFLDPATFDLGADWQDGTLGSVGIIAINDDTIILPSGDLLPLADAITRITGQPVGAEILPAPPAPPPPAAPAPDIMPLPNPARLPVVPEPTVAPEPAAAAAGATRAAVIPWALLVIGLASGLGAIIGMLRSRRQED